MSKKTYTEHVDVQLFNKSFNIIHSFCLNPNIARPLCANYLCIIQYSLFIQKVASPISVYIEMPVWLKKYLISESINKEEPLIFHPKHDYNTLLARLVTNNRKTEPPDYDKQGIKIMLPWSKMKDVYFYNKLSTDSRQIFRNQIYRDVYYDFKIFLKDMTLKGMQRKIALERFFLCHQITDDDINYASFYRSFTRYIQKRRVNYYESAFTDLNRQSVLLLTRKTA